MKGAVQLTVTPELETNVVVGATGVLGLAADLIITCSEYVLYPSEFLASTLNVYKVS